MDFTNDTVLPEVKEGAADSESSAALDSEKVDDVGCGKRKRKGNPVKVTVRVAQDGEEFSAPAHHHQNERTSEGCRRQRGASSRGGRGGGRLMRHYSTLKKDYEELKQRYDSLKKMVESSRQLKNPTRTCLRTNNKNEDTVESPENAEGEKEGEISNAEDGRRDLKVESGSSAPECGVGRTERTEQEKEESPPAARRVTRSETRRKGRPSKSVLGGKPLSMNMQPQSPSLKSGNRRRRRTPVQLQASSTLLLRKQRKDKGRRRSPMHPKERRRLWRQNRPVNKCDYCEYETRDKTCFKNHVSAHDPQARRFLCDICSKTFRCKRGIQNHKLSHDSPERLHRCDRCSFRTPHKLNWVQHLAVIHKVDPEGQSVSESIRCQQCKFTCVAAHQLKAHVLRKHTLDKPFKCSQCDYSTVIRHELETHVGIRHQNERKYMCDACGFRSQTQGGLTRHKRTHTGAKPFVCPTCHACYADSGKLKTHLLRHTSDEKPFVCHVCGHASRRRDNLRMHLKRIHGANLEVIRGHRRFQQHTAVASGSLSSSVAFQPPPARQEATLAEEDLEPQQNRQEEEDSRHFVLHGQSLDCLDHALGLQRNHLLPVDQGPQLALLPQRCHTLA